MVLLMLGWPLAVPVLCAIGAIAFLVADMSWAQSVDLTLWLGIVAVTLASERM